ncbi:hypothetical protein MUK42_13357 [Musa troglodytarum]|uniref:Uncharacterized protein n=1 Tax=Musa troglodytarum TaxID=320322 RepID=A0A9E7HKU2_9LILI|nr:hypothetical protein MUK42_13357 [Musa troglodytarum]
MWNKYPTCANVDPIAVSAVSLNVHNGLHIHLQQYSIQPSLLASHCFLHPIRRCYELEAEASEHYHPTRTVGASISIPRVELSSPLACPETSDLHLWWDSKFLVTLPDAGNKWDAT